MNAEAYTRMVLQLFPSGPAWAGDRMRQFAQAVADELARIHGRAAVLIEERDPRTATETLEQWEDEVGLPDPCVADWGALTIDERRMAVVSRQVNVNSQSKQFFLDIAETLGYSPAIETYLPFQVGRSKVTEKLFNGEWVFTWTVRGDGADSEQLQCALEAKKPAYSILLFDSP